MVGHQLLGLLAGAVAKKQRADVGRVDVWLCPHGDGYEALHLGDRNIGFDFAEHHHAMSIERAAADDVECVFLTVAADVFGGR